LLLKALEVLVPKPFVFRDPVPYFAESFGDKMVAALASVPLFGHEASIEEDAKVLGNCRPAHLEMPRNHVDGAVGPGEQIEHLPPRRMADCCENVGRAIGSHHAANIRKQLLTCQAENSSSNRMAQFTDLSLSLPGTERHGLLVGDSGMPARKSSMARLPLRFETTSARRIGCDGLVIKDSG
jgi:hypothetical protein